MTGASATAPAAALILEEALHVKYLAGQIINHVNTGHPDEAEAYAAEIVASGQHIKAACVDLQSGRSSEKG